MYHYPTTGTWIGIGHYPIPNPDMFYPTASKNIAKKPNDQNKDLHMFVWSSSASPVLDVFGGGHEYDHKELKLIVSPGKGFIFF